MKVLQTNRFVAVLATVFSVIFCLSEDIKADWVLVQNQPVRIYRDTRTGLEWSVTLDSAEHDHDYARQLVAQYGLRLPTWDELRDVVNNSGGINQLNIKKGYTDLYETSDPDVLAGAYGGSISTKRPRMPLLTESWVIGVRKGSGSSNPPKNPSTGGGGGGFTPGEIINPEYGDRITHINNIPIRDTDHFSQIIRNADTHITYTLVDQRTGNAYVFAADLLPKGSTSRLGIYIHNDSRGGVMVTGVMEDSPGMYSRFVRNWNGNVNPPNPGTGGGSGSGGGFKPGQIINPEYGDRITYINNIKVRDEDHFREIIRNADTRITFTLIDQRTGNAYKFTTDLWPQGSTTRLGIYVQDDSRGGVMVTGVMEGSPGMNCRYVAADNQQSNVGKLYTLTVWAGGDLEEYTSSFSTVLNWMFLTCGLSPDSKYDNDSYVNFCAEAITLSDKKDDNGSYISRVTNYDVLENCRYLGQKAGKNDVILVYMCCHGKTARTDGSNRRYHILFPGIKNSRGMKDNSNGIKRSEIIEALNPQAHRLTVLITDSCTYYEDNEAKPKIKNSNREARPAFQPWTVQNNRFWLLLRTNTGLIDWNSTSPNGGYERQGEYSSVYQDITMPRNNDLCGIFFDSFNKYCNEQINSNVNRFSTSEFFSGLQNRLSAEFTRCKNNPTIRATDEDTYNNQSTQTLFDFKGLGYAY